MILTTLALIDGQVLDADELALDTLAVGPPPRACSRGLLATVVAVEDASFALAYTTLVVYALGLDAGHHPVSVDLLRPLLELAEGERAALRAALARQSWDAWARAPLHVRALLGCAEPPLLLAEAARQLGLALPTLAAAAARGRLPTICAGDRRLVYLATVREAQERGLLHDRPGRPARPRRS
jgi:hypothetical protein